MNLDFIKYDSLLSSRFVSCFMGDKKLLLRATSVLCLLIPQEAAKSAAASVAGKV